MVVAWVVKSHHIMDLLLRRLGARPLDQKGWVQKYAHQTLATTEVLACLVSTAPSVLVALGSQVSLLRAEVKLLSLHT